MTTPQNPDDDRTVDLGAAPPSADETVRLGKPAPAANPDATVQLTRGPVPPADPEGTVRLGRPDPDGTVRLPYAKPAPDPEGTVRLGPAQPRPAAQPYVPPQQPAGPPPREGFDSATFLDPQVWPTPPVGTPVPAAAPVPPAPVPAEGLQRFGPGVPPQAAAVWHGAAAVPPEPGRRKRRRGRLVLPLLLLLAVLAWFAWDRYGRPVQVTGLSVRTDSARGPACDGTAVITGTVRTDGGSGTFRYRWRRSDGSDSGVLTQPVASGRQSTDVVLRWTFQGHGSMQASATLEIVGQGGGTASVEFPYTCR